MQIFIDESGSFLSGSDLTRRVSCIGALTIPQEVFDELASEFMKLDCVKLNRDEELKGSALGERAILEMLELLSRFEAVFQPVAIGSRNGLGCNFRQGVDLV